MLTQKIQSLVIIVVVVTTVVLLSSLLVINANGVTAQARNEGADGSADRLEGITNLVSRAVYTEEVDFLEGVEVQEGQVEVVDDLQSAILGGGGGLAGIGPQSSSSSGFEYVPCSAFRPIGTSPADGYRFWPTAGYIRNKSSSQVCVAAPVYLPNGATLTQFFTFFMDDHATADLTVLLLRKDHTAAHAGDLSELVVGVTWPGVDSSTIYVGYPDPFPSGLTVSNDYGYTIYFCFDENTGLEQKVYGFIVTYDATSTSTTLGVEFKN